MMKSEKDLSKYTKGKNNNTAKTEEEMDKSALEYLTSKQLSMLEIQEKIDAMRKEFGGIISEEGATHIIAREMGWTPPLTRRKTVEELPVMSKQYLEEKASVTKEIQSEDGKSITYVGTWGSFIAVPANVSELLTSSRGDNYVIVDLVGEDIAGVPLFLWREKALFKDKIKPSKPAIFRSVLIKHDQQGGYRLSAAHYFGVEKYEQEEGE